MDFEYETLEDWHKYAKKKRHRIIQADAYSYTAYTDRQMYCPDVPLITGGIHRRCTDIWGHADIWGSVQMYGGL